MKVPGIPGVRTPGQGRALQRGVKPRRPRSAPDDGADAANPQPPAARKKLALLPRHFQPFHR